MALFVILVALVAAHYAVLWGLPGTKRLAAWWERWRPAVAGFVRSAPATFTYLFILLVTTETFVTTGNRVAEALLRERSTNLTHLSHDPIRVLVLSAFWTGGRGIIWLVVVFCLVLVPAERWLGTPRAIVLFALGHVGATLVTAAGIAVAIHVGAASHRLAHVIDVGVSYGVVCIAAVLVYRLPSPWNKLLVAGLAAGTLVPVVVQGSFTDFGHLTAAVIGFACYPFTRAVDVRERARRPLYGLRPATPAGPAAPG